MSDQAPLHDRIDALRRTGDLAQARALVQEGLASLDGIERAHVLAALGRLNLDADENHAASAAFEEAAEATSPDTHPDTRASFLLDLGRARRRLGEYPDALAAIDESATLYERAQSSPGRRRALAARGKILYSTKDWKSSRTAFRAALDQPGDEPPAWRLHHAMGRAYEKDGKRAQADRCYQHARDAGWDGVGASSAPPQESPRISGLHTPGAAAALAASTSDSLVEHDDEHELRASATHLGHDDLVRLVSLTGALNSALAPNPLLETLLDRAIQWCNAERGYVVVCRPNPGHDPHVEIRVARDAQASTVANPEDEVSRSIVLRVVRKAAPVITSDASADLRLQEHSSISARGLRSVACFPLRVRSGPALGALYLEHRQRTDTFGEREVALLEALTHHVALAFERSTRYQRLAEAYNETRRALEEHTGAMFGLIGKARSMRQVFRLIDKLRDHDAPVLIEGETGTGKELVARAIHRSSRRHAGPFVVESCGALPEGLLEAELFGHQKGAFTGATEARRGAFERAENGTLFLDEVSDMPERMQALLLRTLEAGEVRPIGAPAPRVVDCRIVCASRQALNELVRQSKFREDLFFRINVIRIEVPPLRERKEDLPALAEAFLKDCGRPSSDLTPQALEALLRHDWPGNIRELRHALERASLLAGSGPIERRHLGLDDIMKTSSGLRNSLSGTRSTSGSQGAGKVEYQGHILNRRQVALLDYLQANGVSTNREYVQLVNVSVPTGWRDLKDLLDKGLIRAEGQGRNTVYRLIDAGHESEGD